MIKGGIEVTGRRGRRRRKLLDDLNERRGYSYLKEEALDRTMWRARFGRWFGTVVRQTAFSKWINKRIKLKMKRIEFGYGWGKVCEQTSTQDFFQTTSFRLVSYSTKDLCNYTLRFAVCFLRLTWADLIQISGEVSSKPQISFNVSILSDVLLSLELQTRAKWNKAIIINRSNAKTFLTNELSLVHTGTHSSHEIHGGNVSEY
jgi:hypothetical protein